MGSGQGGSGDGSLTHFSLTFWMILQVTDLLVIMQTPFLFHRCEKAFEQFYCESLIEKSNNSCIFQNKFVSLHATIKI